MVDPSKTNFHAFSCYIIFGLFSKQIKLDSSSMPIKELLEQTIIFLAKCVRLNLSWNFHVKGPLVSFVKALLSIGDAVEPQ